MGKVIFCAPLLKTGYSKYMFSIEEMGVDSHCFTILLEF